MSDRNLLVAIFINGGIVACEFFFGFLIRSMALISDALHNLSDIAVMAISYGAEKVSRRPSTTKMTFGYRKIEFVAAFVNSIVLSVAIAFILYEAIGRLFNPPPVPGREMLWVATFALLGNGAATLILKKTADRSVNIKTAWLHSLTDSLFSAGVIVSAVMIIVLEWFILDPLISIIICLFIGREIYRIVYHAITSLMDAVPPGIDWQEVQGELQSIEGVSQVNDLHIWQSGTNQLLLSAHLSMMPEMRDSERIIKLAHELLKQKYGIDHATIEVLPFDAKGIDCCYQSNYDIKQTRLNL